MKFVIEKLINFKENQPDENLFLTVLYNYPESYSYFTEHTLPRL
jgi:hypothetical protein